MKVNPITDLFKPNRWEGWISGLRDKSLQSLLLYRILMIANWGNDTEDKLELECDEEGAE